MFPPETTHTTLPPPARPATAAATPAAPAPSATTRLRSTGTRPAPARAERAEPFVVRHRDDLGAEPLDRGDLGRRRADGHDDGAPDAEPPRVPRDALGHVAGARGPYPARELVGGGDGHAIARAAD